MTATRLDPASAGLAQQDVPHTMVGTVLVLGAGGFIGGFIVAALRRAGWRVRRGVRDAVGDDDRSCDFNTRRTAAAWMPLLDGVDVVINAAGILRETRTQRFETLHVDAPLALAEACVARGVRRFVQISALGEPADGAFIASKHRADEALLALPLQMIVLRPSVVYSCAGSYGGTSLLRALAAFPAVLALPGHGRWPLQPVAAEDLAELVVRALNTSACGVFDVGAPTSITLSEYLQQWRRWLRIDTAAVVHVPRPLVSAAAALGEHIGGGPMSATIWRMLQRGNVTAADAQARLLDAFGYAPRALDAAMQERPSQLQDRWHARLYLLDAPLRWAVIVLFALSGVVGLQTPAATIDALVAGSALQGPFTVPLARAAGALDLLLAGGLLMRWRPRMVLAAMIALVLGYTAVFGTLLPASWFDPLGGLAKNVLVLPALAVAWVLAERR